MAGSNPLGVKITKRQELEDVLAGIQAIAKTEILVGFPENTTERDKDPNDKEGDREITNAALGYIHDNGVPELGIPARPFMLEGMKRAETAVVAYLEGALKAAAQGKVTVAEGQMIGAGMAAKLSIQNRIQEGIPPPLSEYTLRKRAARGKGSMVGKAAQKELDARDKGLPPSVDIASPLIDTSQMLKAVNYVMRARSARSK